MLFCCLRRNALRRLVINTSSSVSRDQQTTSLIATSDEYRQLDTVRRSCVYNTWRSHRWQHAMKPDVGRESRFLPTPPAFEASVRGPCRNIAIMFGVEKLEWCGYPSVKKCEDVFILFDRIHERDRQIDGRTNTARRHGPHLCIAPRGKNACNFAINKSCE